MKTTYAATAADEHSKTKDPLPTRPRGGHGG